VRWDEEDQEEDDEEGKRRGSGDAIGSKNDSRETTLF